MRIFRFFIVLILGLLLLRDSVTLFGIVRFNLSLIRRHPDWSYDQKMEEKVGKGFYNYARFIKKNTPSDAVILIPPQSYPWQQSGNIAYLRYFLYPRKLFNGSESKDLEKKELTHVLLASGENVAPDELPRTTWPNFKVPAKRILLEVSPGAENLNVRIVPGDYLPEKFKSEWGIIELK